LPICSSSSGSSRLSTGCGLSGTQLQTCNCLLSGSRSLRLIWDSEPYLPVITLSYSSYRVTLTFHVTGSPATPTSLSGSLHWIWDSGTARRSPGSRSNSPATGSERQARRWWANSSRVGGQVGNQTALQRGLARLPRLPQTATECCGSSCVRLKLT
jgi:hypothetical protein